MPPPHIALVPSAGMGHITPFLRLAAMLASHNCIVTLITVKPTVSVAESNHISHFFSAHPHIKSLELQLLPFLPSNPTKADPFFLQMESINRSNHLLGPLLSSSSPPFSAIFSDILVLASVSPIADQLSIPIYIVSTTSVRFLSLIAYLSSTNFSCSRDEDVQVPSLAPLPASSIPPPLFNQNHPFTVLSSSNTLYLSKAKGVLFNTFNLFEPETINTLNVARVLSNFPPVLPVGPLQPCDFKKSYHLPWLEHQRPGSVVYVSFGSRTAMSKDQIRELGNGLETSGCEFLWVLKGNIVDKDDSEDLENLLDGSYIERTKNRGMVVKGWVSQEEILAHPAVGGFVSHCGWNSVMEAAQQGVPILAWPQHGDQKVNAEVVEKAGLGIWFRHWGWAGERVVKGEEIAEKVREMMEDENLRGSAGKVGKEASKAGEADGSSEKVLMGIIEMLKPKEGTNSY